MSGPKIFGAWIVALSVIGASVGAQAGNRLYSMERLLAQPHPFAQSGVAPATIAVAPIAAPLPGARYTTGRSIGASAPLSAPQPAPVQSAARVAAISPKSDRNARSRSWVSEIVGGIFVHDPAGGNTESDTWDLNLEIIFRKVELISFENRYLRFLFTPHPILGGSVNNENETHVAYLGLNWQHNFENGLFLAGSLGMAYHTGNLDQEEEVCPPPGVCSLPGNRRFVNTGEVTLGSRILFRESIEFGYRLTRRHGISLYLAHMSNASLFDDDNDGINFAGIRYRFAFE